MIIKNGLVIDPKNQLEAVKDILIVDGRIKLVADSLDITKYKDEEVVNAEGKWVIPGAIDLHVHLREPGFEYKETIETGAASAAKGGVTTICAMPNTRPVVDTKDVVERIYAIAKEKAVVNVLQIGAITKGQEGKELADLKEMKEAGICGISEDGRTVMNSKLLKEAMQIAKKEDLLVLSHCEDEALAKGTMNEGMVAERLGLPGIPKEAEDIIAARDIQLAAAVGVKLHLCHVSTKNSVEILKFAKEHQVQVTGEVCPHHFTLTEESVDGIDTNTKMNPPLREQVDVDALKEGLRDGVLDVIATDHAPHHYDDKNKKYIDAANGIIGLETMIPLSITELVKTGYLTKNQLVEKVSYNPAKILNLDKGHLSIGGIADITIIDPNVEYTIKETDIVSKSKNTPFIGRTVTGKIEGTIVAGKFVYRA